VSWHKGIVREKEKIMKTKIVIAIGLLSWTPLAFATGKPAYPKQNVAAFVVEKLDVNSLPASFRPKKQKGKATLADYGYKTEKVGENEAVIEQPDSSMTLSIKVLDSRPSGIYACVSQVPSDNDNAKMHTVILLKSKDADSLLKGRESASEFASCPVPQHTENSAIPSLYPAD
jgi:hypothetical protein